jgi:beta-hydroxyacyl-ACP dehydratase FabZ
MTDSENKILDIEAILERLPHRFPFLLVDRVLSVEAGKSIVALKNVTANEAHFVGHFPGHPVMPGVLIVEALAQAGGILAWETSDDSNIWILYLVGLDNIRFKQTVRPGDQILLKVNLTQRRRNLWKFGAVAEVDGKVVAEADILMADGPKS